MTRCSDVEIGIFTSSDPIRDGVNWWNYCNGNPISYKDFLGLFPYNNLNEAMEDYYTNYSTEADRKQMLFYHGYLGYE